MLRTKVQHAIPVGPLNDPLVTRAFHFLLLCSTVRAQFSAFRLKPGYSSCHGCFLRKVAITDHDLCALYWSSSNDFIDGFVRRRCARWFRAIRRHLSPQL